MGNSIEVPWSAVAQSCLTLCNPMDCSLPGSSIHGIFQARILEWVAISLSRGSSWSRDWTRVSHIVGRRFTIWATKEALKLKIELPYDPTIPFLSTYLEKTILWKDSGTPLFTAALFTLAKTRKQPKCPLMNG